MKKIGLYGSLLSLTAILVACPANSGTTPPPSGGNNTNTAPTSISGTVQGWNSGAGVVELLPSSYADKSATNPALSSGTINADGSFSVALPSAAAVTPYLSTFTNTFSPGSSCTGGFTSSTAGAQGLGISLLNVRQNGKYVTSLSPTVTTSQTSGNTLTLTATSKVWLYVNAATTLSGQISCTSTSGSTTSTAKLSVNAALNQGWNVLVETLTTTGVAGSGQSSTTGSVAVTNDASIAWQKLDLSAASLHSDSFAGNTVLDRAAAAFERASNR